MRSQSWAELFDERTQFCAVGPNGGRPDTCPGDSGGPMTATDGVTPSTPAEERIEIRGGEVVGGPKTIKVTKGDRVRIVVSTNQEDDLHLHGYDIEKTAKPGQPARFKFKANAEGEFELESHTAEHAGLEPLVATLIVEPR